MAHHYRYVCYILHKPSIKTEGSNDFARAVPSSVCLLSFANFQASIAASSWYAWEFHACFTSAMTSSVIRSLSKSVSSSFDPLTQQLSQDNGPGMFYRLPVRQRECALWPILSANTSLLLISRYYSSFSPCALDVLDALSYAILMSRCVLPG